jgi:hypothetical protein
MKIEESIKHLVIDPLRLDRQTAELLRTKGDSFDDYVRTIMLERGSSYLENKLMARLYAYTHMLQHYDALWTVLQLKSERVGVSVFDHSGEIGILDVGCGPLTATLSLADEYAARFGTRLSASVVGIDHAQATLDLAKKFFDRGHLSADSTFHGIADFGLDAAKQVGKLMRGKRTLVLVCSYFFGQPAIGDVDKLAGFCKSVLSSVQPAHSTLIYLNASTTQAASKYIDFTASMGLGRNESRTDYQFRVYRQLRAAPEECRIATVGEPLTYGVFPLDWASYAAA